MSSRKHTNPVSAVSSRWGRMVGLAAKASYLSSSPSWVLAVLKSLNFMVILEAIVEGLGKAR